MHAVRERPSPRIDAFTIPAVDLAGVVSFYEDGLACRVAGTTARAATLTLGEERLVVETAPAGTPSPPASNTPGFAHIAVVVSDIDRAFARAVQAGARAVSTQPQHIPRDNPVSGGVWSAYLRDPEGHPFELIAFPPGKGDPRFARRSELFLGIDHTAFVTTDTMRSRELFCELLGFRVATVTVNHGIEQEVLSGVPGARVRITALRTSCGPGIELLEYEVPRSGDAERSVNRWSVPTPDIRVEPLEALETAIVASGLATSHHRINAQTFVFWDADGHQVTLTGAAA